jgi:chromosome segregation ATPase
MALIESMTIENLASEVKRLSEELAGLRRSYTSVREAWVECDQELRHITDKLADQNEALQLLADHGIHRIPNGREGLADCIRMLIAKLGGK